MTADALKALLSSPAALFVLMMVAALSNGLKQILVVKQSGTPMSLGSYVTYWPETLATVLANGIAFVVLVLTDQLNFASALGIGYGTNSLVDLLPGKRSLALKATPDDPAKVVGPIPPKTGGFVRPLMLACLLALGVGSVAVLPACSTLGLAPAQTFNDKLAYAYGQHTAVLQAITNGVNSGALSSTDAQSVLNQASTARTVLDAAKAARTAGDTAGANDKLTLALSALTALQTFMNTHGGAK